MARFKKFSEWMEESPEPVVDYMAKFYADQKKYGFTDTDIENPNYRRYLMDKGHGPQIGSCGHVVGSCRCEHGRDRRLAHHVDRKCAKCQSEEE